MTTIAKRQKHLDGLLRKLNRTIPHVGQRCVPAQSRVARPEKDPIAEDYRGSGLASGHCFCHKDEMLRCLIESFLCWNTRGDDALKVMHLLDARLVDANELRVMMPGEVAELLGSEFDDVFAVERIERLLGTLGELYKREHKVSLGQFAGKPHKALMTYVGGLASPPRYVVDRLGILQCSSTRVPIDDLSLRLLIDAQVMEPEATPEEASDFVSRHVKEANLLAAFQNLEAAPISEDWRMPSEPIQPTASDEAIDRAAQPGEHVEVKVATKKVASKAKPPATEKAKKPAKTATKPSKVASKSAKGNKSSKASKG